jgi:ankyrin repeat domain-containing protein 17
VADGTDVFLFHQVVELLLTRGANKEHRNVSDYTPLSLAASGGYVNIIKLLLAHGAEINSRTGSKLGISPLMLAAMNGHTGKFNFYVLLYKI